MLEFYIYYYKLNNNFIKVLFFKISITIMPIFGTSKSLIQIQTFGKILTLIEKNKFR